MNEYLLDLRNAFESVSRAHYEVVGLNREGNRVLQPAENDFSRVVVTNWEEIARREDRRNCYMDLQFNFDLDKLRVGIRPDIVLHNAPDNQDRQEICIEVKTSPAVELRRDLEKLIQAISNNLNFNNAIMIVVNKNLKSTLKIIRNFIRFSNLDEESLSKLYLYHGRIDNENQDRIIYNYFSFSDLENPIV